MYGGVPSNIPNSAPLVLLNTTSVNPYFLPIFPNNTNSNVFQQSYLGAALDLGFGTNSIWVFGGYNLNNNNTATSSQAYLYNYVLNQFSATQGFAPGNFSRFGHTASLSNDGKNIYVMGGTIIMPGMDHTSNITDTYLNDIWVYDTSTTLWTINNITGNINSWPTGRKFHTATTIPGTTHILIFGGELTTGSYQLVNDPVYLYDYQQNQFQKVSLANSDNRPTMLSGHSAVYYKDPITSEQYVFILFGQGVNGNPTNATNIINVTDVTNLAWVKDQASSSAGATSNGSSSLSTGAIAGIAVGAAIAGIGITGALIFSVLRKRRAKQQFVLQSTDPRNHDGAYVEETTFAVQTSMPEQDGKMSVYSSPVSQPSTTKPYDGATQTLLSKPDDGEFATKPFEQSPMTEATKPFQDEPTVVFTKPFDTNAK
ncbi:hypothetical protein DM01DRAFT_1338466 [Hesseltinella vesiculosa]|uniref:Galactose oxidase n=1 Tax=Hesseltinella vesiculosa TaxID=101127 RepID=A0A1X2G9W8_9FUNG|nr:hypothetical protein DM01DRAFT_1338466 [Hesseltinella vesiculosa]